MKSGENCEDKMTQNKPIRVLQILGNCVAGGVEAVIMNYYRNIDRSLVQFDMVVHKFPVKFVVDEARELGANVYEVTPISKNPFAYMLQIYEICKKSSYKIIEVNMNSLSGFALFAAWLAGVPVRILHNHTTVAKEEKLRGIVKNILRPFARCFANRYFACGKDAAIWMYGRQAFEAGKVKLVYNAIDTKKYTFNLQKRQTIRKELIIPDGYLVFGHVGRFEQAKNHTFLIEIFNEILKQAPASVLLLIGDGKNRSGIEQLVQELGITQKVKFLGIRDNVQDFYNVMDIFLFPSLFEGLGLVGIEAQANGLPCLVSNRVPNELKVTSKVKFLPLEISATDWATEAIKMVQHRLTDESPIKLANFDITTEADKMTHWYMGHNRGTTVATK